MDSPYMEAHCNKHIASEQTKAQIILPQVQQVDGKNSYNRRNVTIEYNHVLQRAKYINEGFNA